MSDNTLDILVQQMSHQICNDYSGEKNYSLVCEGIYFYINEYRRAAKELNNHSPSIAHSFHSLIDEELKSQKEKDAMWKSVKCKRGCSECCRMGVAITQDEAILLKEYAKDKKIKINKKTLEIQSRFDFSNWHDLNDGHRDCVFLKNGECQIYEHRPIACRTHYQIGNPMECDIKKFKNKVIPMWRPIHLQIISCAISIMGNADLMPVGLLKIL